jgi:4-hydroxybenzoate polyprenyltransferase
MIKSMSNANVNESKASPQPPLRGSERVLCVDLDGSLIASDLLYESFLGLIRSRPIDLLRVPGWLLKGRAHLKRELGVRGGADPKTLPFHEDVLEFLREQRAQGRRMILATAAEESLACQLAEHLGLFDEVLASDGVVNLKGRRKLLALEERFGPGGFDYLGNGWEDLAIWHSAEETIAVRPSRRLREEIQSNFPTARVFERDPESRGRSILRMIRVHQWAKNLLLFVPLITAHRVTDLSLFLACLIAFFAFSFGASSIYIINDLMDLPSDRVHERKRSRPLASGQVSIPVGMAVTGCLLGFSIALGSLLTSDFLLLLLVYLCTSTAYTFVLKKKLMLDVLCLASLYTLRILAGGAATRIVISPWLMAFSMFLFVSLAFVKRYTELASGLAKDQSHLPGRGYQAIDLDMIRSVGPASGYLAVLVVCLYLNDPESRALYHHPTWLWFLCPIILYWNSRIWFLAQRGQMHSDPVVFALTDRHSLIAGLICGLVILCASLF